MKKVFLLLVAVAFLLGCTQPPGQPPVQPPTQPPTDPSLPVAETQLSGVNYSVSDVTLSDNRDMVIDIRVLVKPLEQSASRDYYVVPSLEKNGIKEVRATSDWGYPELSFKDVVSPTKVSLTRIGGVYSNYRWDPKYAKMGTYNLVLEIHNSNTKELLATIKKPIVLEPNAPKVQ